MTEVPEELKKRFVSALETTGFPLENFVCNKLDASEWHAINGRYYCDDIDGKAREIDVLAYKIHKGSAVDVVSVLLISCKKDHSNSWIFLTKRKPKRDPNFRWDPLCTYTANPLVSSLWKDHLLDEHYKASIGRLKGQLIDVDKNVFAFQLVKNEAPQNDKPIFGSIESLLKARQHEIKNFIAKSSPLTRKKRRRVYMFELVTIVDAALYEASYSGDQCSIRSTKHLKYLARYIVDKEDVVARVHFIHKGETSLALRRFNSLAKRGAEVLDRYVASAYERWWEAPQLGVFRDVVSPKIRAASEPFLIGQDINDFETMLNLKNNEGVMELEVPLNADELARLNSLRGLSRTISRILREEMKFAGKHVFVELRWHE